MTRLIACIALGLSLALPNVSEAHGGHGGGGHGGFHGGGSHGGFGRFHDYGFFYGGFGPDFYDYGPGYYDYFSSSPALVLAPPVAAAAQSPAAYWYYCPVAQAYYPYVNVCPSGWQMVPAQAAAISK